MEVTAEGDKAAGQKPKTATIYVDNKPYEVKEGQNLLKACLSQGLNVPYFCWHPALGSVGACRLCAVQQFQDEKDTRGRLVMSCMTPATNGTRISLEHPDAKGFRAGVLEWLMANHPHDCPVCDEGGECHLQDMTVMTGHNYRDYRFDKRTHRNQDLGPFINHEMNRCIQCYRCTRYYRDYAGGRDLDVFGAHDNVYFGRHEDGALENPFSGNLVEVCPTGVFTDKTLKKHYTRKWDLETAASVCAHCSLGCNTIPGERYGQLARILNRYNGEVNGYFLCDRGRFGYEFVNGEQRVRRATLPGKGHDAPQMPGKDIVLRRAAEGLKGRTIGIGSPRASLEANFALRTLVGAENFYDGLSAREHELAAAGLEILRHGPAHTPAMHEVEQCDAVLVLGEDVTNFAPRLALSLRQSIRNKPMEATRKMGIPDWNDLAVREVVQKDKGPMFIATPAATPLDDAATGTYRAAPDDIARLGFAVAHELNNQFPAVDGLAAEAKKLAAEIAKTLKEAKRPLIVSGTGLGSLAVLQAAANVAWALSRPEKPADLTLLFPESNSLGLAYFGANSLEDAIQSAKSLPVETIIVLENDIYRRIESSAANAFLDGAKHVVLLDSISHATAAKAEVVLPSASFAEGDGTFINNEGRAQRYFQVFVPKDEIQESWRWIKDLMALSGQTEAQSWEHMGDVIEAMTAALPSLKPVEKAAPDADFRIQDRKVARMSPRATGRTAMLANINVSEPKPPEDADAPMSFSMEGVPSNPQVPGSLVNRFWAPGWNSVQSLNKFQSEVGGPLVGGDPGVRMIEPSSNGTNGKLSHYKDVPAAAEPRAGGFTLVPLYHIFGSEELSSRSPSVAQRSLKAYAALNPSDAEKLQIKEGDGVKITVGAAVVRLPAVINVSLPAGIAGLPVGLPGVPDMLLPGAGKVEKV